MQNRKKKTERASWHVNAIKDDYEAGQKTV